MPNSNNRHAGAELTAEAQRFVEDILRRDFKLVVFDCDDTLWAGDNGKAFLFWEIAQGVLPPKIVEWVIPRYAAYERGEVDEETMCGEMVSIHAGMKLGEIEAAATRFCNEVIVGCIFPEMLELALCLKAAGCEIWAVSSTNEWVIREGVRPYGIAAERVLAASVICENGVATERILRVPTGPGKASAIREVIGREVDAVFGNSRHDLAMLELARNPFAVNPNPDLQLIAEGRGWPVYWPQTLARTAERASIAK